VQDVKIIPNQTSFSRKVVHRLFLKLVKTDLPYPTSSLMRQFPPNIIGLKNWAIPVFLLIIQIQPVKVLIFQEYPALPQMALCCLLLYGGEGTYMTLTPFFCYYFNMTQSNIVKIIFCSPQSTTMSKEAFVDALIRDIRSDRKIGYAGYIKKTSLSDYLSRRISNNLEIYKYLTLDDKRRIKKIIQSTVQKCHRQLPLPTLPLFVFIFPWLALEYDKEFGGVNGFTPYMNTIHLFVSPNKFSFKSLQKTIAHEFNHAVFFHYHTSKQTLLDTIIFEGLAENFREEVIGGSSSSWSVALPLKKSKEIFNSLKRSLNSKNPLLYQEVFFGGEKYKKWTGYSIGYRIVKSFRRVYSKMSWKEILKMDPKEIFDASAFIKK